MKIVAIDTETTGLSSFYNEIIEVGGAIMEDGKVLQEFDFLMKPSRPIPLKITELTHITNEMVASKGVARDEVKQKIKEILFNNHIDRIVMHNAPFDKRFLEAFLKEELPTEKVRDTLKISRLLKIPTTNYKLGTLTEYFKIELQNAHRAADDAIACGNLFFKLKEMKENEQK